MFQYSNQPFSNPPNGRDRLGLSRASHLVLTSPELLSRILSLLGTRDLLISGQRISRTWHKIIADTPSLQEALFFAFPPSTAPRLLNPLLREIWPLWFKSPSSYSKKRPRPKASDFRFLEWTQRPSAFRRRDASWRKMLVVSGGTEITALKVTLHTQSFLGWEENQGVLLCPDGLRMGVLWDLTKDWCMYDEDATFVMNWDEELVSDGSGTVQSSPDPVEGRHWRHKLKKIFPGKQAKKGLTAMALKSATSSAANVYAYSTDGSLESGEERSVEVILAYSIDNQDPGFNRPPVLGPEFQSEAHEMVSIAYGKGIPISGP